MTIRNQTRNFEAAIEAFLQILKQEKDNHRGGYVTSVKMQQAIKPYISSQSDMKRRVQEVAERIVCQEIAPIVADERGYKLATTPEQLQDAVDKSAKMMRKFLDRKIALMNMMSRLQRASDARVPISN